MSEQFPEYLYADDATGQLNGLAKSFAQVQKLRKGMELREQSFPHSKKKDKRGNAPSYALQRVWEAENAEQKRLEDTLDGHLMGPWLGQFKGLGGALVARVLGEIRHPLRFPGQRCTEGCYAPPIFEVGETCPMIRWDKAEKDEETGAWLPSKSRPCKGTMQEPRARIDPRTERPETGVRSLFHFCGLIAVDGHAQGYSDLEEGQIRPWNSKLKTLLLQPKGVGEQIVFHKPEPYYSQHERSYVQALERLARRDGVDMDAKTESDKTPPEVIRLKKIARKICVKLWLGDLLMEWKRLIA